MACVGEEEFVHVSYPTEYSTAFCAEPRVGGNAGGGELVFVSAPDAGCFTGQITANGGQHGESDGQNGVVTGP